MEHVKPQDVEYVRSSLDVKDWSTKKKIAKMQLQRVFGHFQTPWKTISNIVPCLKIPKLSKQEIDELSMGLECKMRGIGLFDSSFSTILAAYQIYAGVQ